MLDVHAPEHPIHGIRDFFLHLLTITVGLFIALSLENAVEWVHHRHLRQEADANIISEIRDNEHELDGLLEHVPDERKYLLTALQFLNAHMLGKHIDIKDLELTLSLGELRDASWQTANASGALTYMEYEHTKRYAAAYALQSQFLNLQQDTLTAYLTMQSNIVGGDDPEKLSMSDSERAKVQVQQALARLNAMQQIGTSLRNSYKTALDPK